MNVENIELNQLQILEVNSDRKDHAFFSRYTSRQWTIFLILCAINLCSNTCSSLHSLLFTKMAISKGVLASTYGVVFSAYELTNFLACVAYAKILSKLGVKEMIIYGSILVAGCYIIFGFLDRIPTKAAFISLSFCIRIVEAFGYSAYFTATYATIAREFPENIASTFSVLETLNAVGMIVAPVIGGFMYEIGGYLIPYAVTGSLLLVTTCVAMCLFPRIDDPPSRPSSIIKLLKIPAISIYYYTVVTDMFCLGFVATLLQPHLSQFNLRPSVMGLIFMINGGSFALSATLWSLLAEKYINPKLICALGGIISALCFIFIGPAPFLSIKPELWLLILALMLQGIGGSAEYICAFLDSTRETLAHGFPDNIETYGLISGLWTSGISLGSLLGPSASGVLYDSIGFSYTALILVLMHTLVILLSIGSYKFSARKHEVADVIKSNM